MRTHVLIAVSLVIVDVSYSAKTKRGSYSVQEMNQEYSPSGGGDGGDGGFSSGPWPGGDGMTDASYSGGGMSYMNYGGSGGDNNGGNNGHGDFMSGGHSSAMSGGFGGSEGGFHAIQGEVIMDHPPSMFEYKPPHRGKDINDLPHILPPGGKSIEQLQDEADFHLKKLFFESKVNQNSVQDKIRKLKENYGYGTFGYDGYKSSIKYEPIDLGTHNAIDLGTSIDFNGLKGHHGKLKLPVQTVKVTKTLGIHVPEPYPVKQEVPVPAPFPVPHPVPVPQHDNFQHLVHEFVGHISSNFEDESYGKSSYPGHDSPVSKIVRYHENLPRTPGKSYSSYRSPSHDYQAATEHLEYLMPPPPPSGSSHHHYSS